MFSGLSGFLFLWFYIGNLQNVKIFKTISNCVSVYYRHYRKFDKMDEWFHITAKLDLYFSPYNRK